HSLSYGLLEIAIGGGQDSDIDRDALGAAYGTDFLLLNSAQQLGLEINGKLSNLVEKYRAALGDCQQAIFGLHGSGKRSFYVAEEFAFDQGGDEGAAVHEDERLVGARSGEMNGARHHFLAGSAFPQN